MTRDLDAAADVLRSAHRVFVITGAGVSTASGIPDYRDTDGSWKRQPPLQFRDFVRSGDMRRRYWARSQVGWRTFGAAVPNSAHQALAALERQTRVGLVVTQNVDGLHQRAGSHNVLDLHGRLDRVICLACGDTRPREQWQRRLDDANPDWRTVDATVAPDGDADVETVDFAAYAVPDCARCGGMVKPDVVFYGEGVPPWRHTQATAALEASDAVLVVGSSLMVQSSFRYVRRADSLGLPRVALNRGRTRADGGWAAKVDTPAETALPALASRLTD